MGNIYLTRPWGWFFFFVCWSFTEFLNFLSLTVVLFNISNGICWPGALSLEFLFKPFLPHGLHLDRWAAMERIGGRKICRITLEQNIKFSFQCCSSFSHEPMFQGQFWSKTYTRVRKEEFCLMACTWIDEQRWKEVGQGNLLCHKWSKTYKKEGEIDFGIFF